MNEYYRPIKESYLTDTRLTGDQVRIINYLAAQKQGYRLNQNWLRDQLGIGRDRMKVTCAELRKLGYLKTDKPKHSNGRLRQQGSVLDWSKVVSTDGLKTSPSVSPAETPQNPRSYSRTENQATSIQTNITNMIPTEEKDETKTTLSERLRREILAANNEGDLMQLWTTYKDQWTTEMSTLATGRKKYLTARKQIEATRSHSLPSAIETQLNELDAAWDKAVKSLAD